MPRSSDHRFEDDAVAEAFELEQCAATVLGVVAGDEVVATEIVVAGGGWLGRAKRRRAGRQSGWRAVEPRHHQRQAATFTWTEGNIGGYIDQDVVLAYGKTYNGWTILPTRSIRSLRE